MANEQELVPLIGVDDPYSAFGWDGNFEVPTKNSVRDKFETLVPPQNIGQTLGGEFISLGASWTARDSSRNWNSVAMSADGKYQSATVSGGQIYVSSDYGVTWAAKDTSRNWTSIAMSANGLYQTATVSGGQIYVSWDYGLTWAAKDSSRSWTSVAMSSTGSYQTATVGTGLIYVSADYGLSWTSTASSRNWTSVAVSSTGKYQTGVVFSGQIYVSSDFGVTWAAKAISGTWGTISMSSDGRYQTAATLSGTSLLYISSDFGASWASTGLNHTWGGNTISSTGRFQTIVDQAPGLIYVSDSYGLTWAAVSSSRGWSDVAMSADGKYQTAVVYGGQIYTNVNTVDFEYHLLSLPTTDPLIVNALWNNNGKVAVSGGPTEISITTTATATIDRDHVISGTSANYTVTLPSASGKGGHTIGLRIAANATKLFTVTDGTFTKVLWANESLILRSDGTNWIRVAEVGVAMVAGMLLNATGALMTAGTWTKIPLDTADIDNTGLMVDTTNNKILIVRTGLYTIAGTVGYSGDGAGQTYMSDSSGCINMCQKNSTSAFTNRVGESFGHFASGDPAAGPFFMSDVQLSAGDYLILAGYFGAGTSVYYFKGTFGCVLRVKEILS